MQKELLKKLGCETIYSAKGHFKACDIRRTAISLTIWLCAIINILCLIGINQVADKWLAGVALMGTIALLIWNEGEGKEYRTRHKLIAEEYLALHKSIRACFFLNECNNEEVGEYSLKVSELDKSAKPEISWLAQKWAKSSIEADNEVDNWFK